ncbi:MAG: M23 family metallopeptidase [Pelosinus sp.]|nr:M23 family metallopeptidase [Pelosinus sp.]
MIKSKVPKPKKKERREYTLMIVPHQGQAIVRTLRVPLNLLKGIAAVLCIAAIAGAGAFFNYQRAIHTVNQDQSELKNLRQVNGSQVQQIEQLAKATAALQQDMNRLNMLDAEIRRIVNSTENTDTSRGGMNRNNQAGKDAYTGQGGPNMPAVSDLIKKVDELKAEVKVREQSLTDLKNALEEKNSRINAMPSIWPTGGQVTSPFGWRSSPFSGGGDFHPGMDIANDAGTPIVATADGVVIYSDWYGGYGKLVQIDHGNGIQTLYGHNSQIAVSVGQKVSKGQVVSYMGSTGLSTGNHCHYEVRVNGQAVDPTKYL